MKHLLTLFIAILCLQLTAQSPGHVYDMVMAEQSHFRSEVQLNLFEVLPLSSRGSAVVHDVVNDATVLQLDFDKFVAARSTEPEHLEVTLPRVNGSDFDLQMIESDVIAPGFELYTSSNPGIPHDYNPGKHYMGIVKGDRNSVVALSVFDDHISGLISTDEGNFVLGKIEDTRDQYVLYNDADLIPDLDWGCGVADDGRGYSVEELTPSSKRDAGDCVRIYIEVHEDITDDKGGVTQAADYVTAVFNQSAILYANDGITITISEMLVWDSPSPYTSNQTSNLLSQFQSNVGNFNGDLGHLVGYAGGGGIAAGFNGICNSNPDNSMCYSGIQSSYNNVPTYSWTVMVVTHEMGHLFGSRHTHACVWNGNNTAIDGCAGSTEGTCPLPGNPSEGGTIMSYCHLTSAGINFNLGFGPQPSAVVNNGVINGSCLAPCNTNCPVPDGLLASNISETSATLSWNAVSEADDYTMEWKTSSGSTWTAQTVSGTSTTLSSLNAGTSYDWRARSNCQGGSGSFSSVQQFTTEGSPPPEYCTSSGSNTSYEWIANVSLANLDHSSGADGGYADYTGQSADLEPGTSYTINLSPGFSGQSYSEYWRVWIDYNGDYDFEDAGELVGEANGNSSVSFSFTTPSSISASSTRMRVSMLWQEYPTSCESFTYGEVEDYTVNFSSQPPPPCEAPNGLSTSDITENSALLSWNSVSEAIDYTVQLRVQGSPSWDLEADISGTAADATGLASGTTYEWRVRSNCSSESSDYSPIESFTTEESSGGCTYESIASDDLESGWGTWNDGGGHCRRHSQDAPYAIGTYCARLRWNKGSSSTYTDDLSLSTFDEVTLDFSFLTRNMSGGDGFSLQASTNGGGSYSTVVQWNVNSDFVNNTRYYEQVVLTGGFTSNTRFRFQADGNRRIDYVYLDDIDISGCNAAAIHFPQLESVDVTESELDFQAEEAISLFDNDEDISVFPNPAIDELTVQFTASSDQDVEVQMRNMNGQIVSQLKVSVDRDLNETSLDVSQLNPGFYLMTIVMEDRVLMKKVIVQ